MDSDESPTVYESLDLARIMHAIPHRYPMLMIDRMKNVVLDHSAIGIKNVRPMSNSFRAIFRIIP